MADPVQQDSRYRVAFDLMLRIAHGDSGAKSADPAYWLKLFEASYTVVNGGSADEAIRSLPKK